MEYLVYSQPYRVFKVELYETHIAAFTASNCKHINSTYECCMQWIGANRHDNTTCFADYKGGTVSIVEVNTGTITDN
jgi:hypothetical protein